MLVTDLTVRSLVSAAGTTHGGAISSAHRCRTMIVRAKKSTRYSACQEWTSVVGGSTFTIERTLSARRALHL